MAPFQFISCQLMLGKKSPFERICLGRPETTIESAGVSGRKTPLCVEPERYLAKTTLYV